MWLQRDLTLAERPRGFHLITREVVEALPELDRLRGGLLHVFVRQTFATLAVYENASAAVLHDFRYWLVAEVP